MWKVLTIVTLIGLCGVVSGVTEETFDCTTKKNGIYANPSDCGSFLMCSGGYRTKQFCPPPLLFSHSLLVCDWPVNVQCKLDSEVTEGPVEETTKAGVGEEGFNCAGWPSGPYPNPEDKTCTSFYECSNGDTYLFQCPHPLIYNQRFYICDWPSESNQCEAGVTTQQPTTTTTTTTTEEPTTTTTTTTTQEPTTTTTTTESTTTTTTQEPTTTTTTTQETTTTTTQEPTTTTTTTESTTTQEPTTTTTTTEPTTTTTQEPTTTTTTTESTTTTTTQEPTTTTTTTQEPTTTTTTQEPTTTTTTEPTTTTTTQEPTTTTTTQEPTTTTTTQEPTTTTTTTESTTTTTTQEPTTTTTTTTEPTTTTTTTTTTTGPTTPKPKFCADKANGLYPNPESCSSYYKCTNHFTFLINCPTDNFFDPNKSVCVPDSNVCQSH